MKKKLSFPKWIDPFTYSDIFLEQIGRKNDTIVSWAVYLVTAFLSALLLYSILGILLQSPSPMVIVVSGSMDPSFYRGDVMVLSGWNIKELKAPIVELPDTSIDGVDIAEYAITMCSVKGFPELVPCRTLSNEIALGGVKREHVLAQEIHFPSINRKTEITKEGDVIVYWSETQNIPVIHRAIAKIRAADGLFVMTKGDSKLNSFVDQDTALSYGAVKIERLHGKTIFMVPMIGYVKLILLDDIPCFIASLFTRAQCVFP